MIELFSFNSQLYQQELGINTVKYQHIVKYSAKIGICNVHDKTMTLQWLCSGTRIVPKYNVAAVTFELRSMASQWCCRGTMMAWQLYGSGAIVAVVLSWQWRYHGRYCIAVMVGNKSGIGVAVLINAHIYKHKVIYNPRNAP